MNRICVFCGSNSGLRPAYAEGARAMGITLARREIGIVYGGGRVGLMGALADAAMAEGGEVIGVIPEALMRREVGHTGVSDLRVVGSMHERKAMMAELSDGFIAMPGGYGTLEEFCEVLTWSQLGLHRKPCGVLNLAGFFNSFREFLDYTVAEKFVRSEHRSLFIVEDEPGRLVDSMLQFQPPQMEKWIDLEGT